MTKSMLFVIAVLIVALGARPVLGGDEREYVGETTVTTLPGVGIIALHDLCIADFPDARMCSSSDIIRNGARAGAALPVDSAWMTPTLVTVTATDSFDASGLPSVGQAGILSCVAWTAVNAPNQGMVLDGGLGTFTRINCNNTRPVACCAARKIKK